MFYDKEMDLTNVYASSILKSIRNAYG